MAYILAALILCSCITEAVTDVGKFWHVSDFHYDHTYWTTQLSCNENVEKPGIYGDYWCDSPWLLVTDSIAHMASIESNVDFILWTGDTVAHIKDAHIDLSTCMEVVQNVTKVLQNKFPNISVLATLGNHDFYPADQAEPQESDLYRRVADMWDKWIVNQSQVQNFKRGGFYMSMPRPNIRVLSLNTNLYYRQNKLTANLSDPASQFQWMREQLQEVRTKGEKVIVTAHVPPGLLTPTFVDWFYPQHKTRFLEILLEYHDVIVATHFGHDHSDGFKILQNENGDRAVTQYTAPSVTPWRYRIPTKTGEPHNPGIRLVEYDRDTGRQLDYKQYYINLTDSNSQNRTNWALLYSFKDAYKVEDMSVASLREIFKRMENGGGREYSSKYCNYAMVSHFKKPCTDEMRADIYCGGLTYDLTQAKTCVSRYLKGAVTGNMSTVTGNMSALFLIASVIASLFKVMW